MEGRSGEEDGGGVGMGKRKVGGGQECGKGW